MTRYLSVCVSLVEYVNFEFVWWRVRENAFPFLLLLTHQPLFIFVWTIIGKMYMIKACHFADLLYFGRKASYPYILKYITSFFRVSALGVFFAWQNMREDKTSSSSSHTEAKILLPVMHVHIQSPACLLSSCVHPVSFYIHAWITVMLPGLATQTFSCT